MKIFDAVFIECINERPASLIGSMVEVELGDEALNHPTPLHVEALSSPDTQAQHKQQTT